MELLFRLFHESIEVVVPRETSHASGTKGVLVSIQPFDIFRIKVCNKLIKSSIAQRRGPMFLDGVRRCFCQVRPRQP